MFQNSYVGKYFEVLNARDCKASAGNREKSLYFKKLVNFRGEHLFDNELKSYAMSIKEATLPADGSLGVIHPILILQGKLSLAEITVMDSKNIRRRIILGTTQALTSHYVSVPFESAGWVSVLIDLRQFVIPFGTTYLCLEKIHLKNAIIRRIFTVEQEYDQYINFPHNLQHSMQLICYIQEIQQKPEKQCEQKRIVNDAPLKTIQQQRPKSQHAIQQQHKSNKENDDQQVKFEKQLSEEQKLARKQLLKEQKLKLQAQHKAEAEHTKQQEEQKQIKLQQLKQIDERCQQFRLRKLKQQQFQQSQIEENQEYSNTELDGLADIIDIIEMKIENKSIVEDKYEIPPRIIELHNPLGKSIITRKGNQTIVIDRRLQMD